MDNNFKHLNDSGLRVQRVLWGSTGTKDPSYSDIKYVNLITDPEKAARRGGGDI